MLARQITGEAHLRALGAMVGDGSTADYVVSSDAEWAIVFANSADTLSGKVVEIRGADFTELTIRDRDMTAAGAPLVIRSADHGSSIQRLVLDGLVRGIDFSGLHFQMRGWPANYSACVKFNNGIFGALRFDRGTSFRHGYGAMMADFDTAAALPEYERVDNVHIATGGSTSFLLSWKDPAASDGWIEFFNRGEETVYCAIGGADVSAGLGDLECPPGQRVRISPLDPRTCTHAAVLASANTSTVNARTEIGLSHYLAAAFQTSGAATLEDIALVGCSFRDLNNGVKGIVSPQKIVVMDCEFERIYQDIIAVAPAAGGSARVLRNLDCVPFARSGTPEGAEGDARDPHGDAFQMFSDGTATIGNVIFAGNRTRVGTRRPGVNHQGVFFSDNDTTPSYSDLFVISAMLIGGSGNGIYIGEIGYPVRDVMVYGATIVNYANVNDTGQRLAVVTDGTGTIYSGSVIAPAFLTPDKPFAQDRNLELAKVASAAAVFPGFEGLASAATRTEIEAALASTAEGAGIGAVATGDAIDWTTSDPEAVIRWDKVPSGAHWAAEGQLAPATLTELPLRKILNRRASQPVVPGPDVEWRSVASDGITQVQPWTSSSGTIEPGQFIQIRTTSSAAAGGRVTATVTVNGFAQSVDLSTALSPVSFLRMPASPAYFVAPTSVPAGTTRITFRAKLKASSISHGMKLFTQASSGCDFTIQSTGAVNATVEDGLGAKMLTNVEILPAGSLLPGIWHDIVFDVDMATRQVTLTFDTEARVTDFTDAGNGVFQSNRQVTFLATATGGNALPHGSEVADLSVFFNGVAHKTISNDAAAANADGWKTGASFE